MTNILISGAGISGPALAHWLDRYGFDVAVVERAGLARPGGQAIDLRGPAVEVAARMVVLDEVRAHSTDLRGMSLLDAQGRELFRTTEATASGGTIDGPDVEILRDDLARILTSAADVEYLVGDSVIELCEHADGVHVTFENAPSRDFDLVVGADGLHSTTRRLVFGPEEGFLRELGGYLAVWSAPNHLGLDRWETIFQVPGDAWGAMAMSVRGNRELRVYLGFDTDGPLPGFDPRDAAANRRALTAHFAEASGEVARLLEHVWQASDFHLDVMAQIRMDSWSRGRTVLLGDAGYCGSPASGQGTSMAMVGAYVLAGELKAAGGDHRAAFAAYEAELRDYVRGSQGLALVNHQAVRSGGGHEHDFAPRAVVDAYFLKDY